MGQTGSEPLLARAVQSRPGVKMNAAHALLPYVANQEINEFPWRRFHRSDAVGMSAAEVVLRHDLPTAPQDVVTG
jgi:hypothetical protein